MDVGESCTSVRVGGIMWRGGYCEGVQGGTSAGAPAVGTMGTCIGGSGRGYCRSRLWGACLWSEI